MDCPIASPRIPIDSTTLLEHFRSILIRDLAPLLNWLTTSCYRRGLPAVCRPGTPPALTSDGVNFCSNNCTNPSTLWIPFATPDRGGLATSSVSVPFQPADRRRCQTF